MHKPLIHYQLALWLMFPGEPKFLKCCYETYPTPAQMESFFHLPKENLRAHGFSDSAISKLQLPDWTTVETYHQWTEQPHHHILSLTDPHYPPLLQNISDAPPILLIKGTPNILQAPQIAMVGSRKASIGGKGHAHHFAKSLAHEGFVITSGLAYGIDACAHQGALEAGGKTIAVLGSGMNRLYPKQHQQLSERIASQGALISEFPLNTPPLARHFPRRNRIISGLCIATIVVEATVKSGSLITARLAAEQGRDVFALPSTLDNPMATGCFALLKDGAYLLENLQDILDLHPAPAPQIASEQTSCTETDHTLTLDKDQQKLVKCMGFELCNLDILVRRTGWSVQKVANMVLNLELNGAIFMEPGGYRVTPKR